MIKEQRPATVRRTPEEALRHIHEAFQDQDGSYWADNVLRAIADTMEDEPQLRVRGVGRVADEPRAFLVLLTDVPTDNQLREMHDYLRQWKRDWEDQ